MTQSLRSKPLALTVLLLAPMLAPMAAAQDPGAYAVPDAAGDAFLIFNPGLPPASTPITAPYDFTELGITNEDEMGLHLYVQVANLKGDPSSLPFIGYAHYQVAARLEGTQIYYDLRWSYEVPTVADSPTGIRPMEDYEVSFCVYEVEEDGMPYYFAPCRQQRVTMQINYETNRFEAFLTKDALMGREPLYGSEPLDIRPLVRGDRLGEIAVNVDRNFPIFISDRLPDEDFAPSYVFKSDAANSRIRLSLGDDNVEADMGDGDFQSGAPSQVESTKVSVTPGTPTLVRVRVENLNAAKRIVNLTAEIPEGGDQWSVAVTPTLHLPAGESRFVNLIVNVSESVEHREESVAIVRGHSLGINGETAALRVELVASVPPGPERKTLYFHAGEVQDYDEFTQTICTAFPCSLDYRWLNTIENDPLATSDDGTRMGFYGGGPEGMQHEVPFQLDTPLAAPIAFDTSQPIEAQLAFSAAATFDAQVGMEIYTWETNRLIASASAPATVGSEPVTVTMLPLVDAARITPQDGAIVARVIVRPPLAGPGAASMLPTFQFVPGESQLTLPLIPDPEAATNLTKGPTFLSLAAQSSKEDFLNPGKAKLFNATIVNEGVETLDARLEVVYDNPDWRVELFPGSRFRLDPGDSAEFALLVHAPENATEGNQLHILVNATNLADQSVHSQLRFTAIVTTSLEIDDESHYYASDAENSAKVVRPPAQNTPGFEVALVLVGALGVAVLRRRR